MANILLIEDEPRLRALLERLFEDAGYHITSASTGSQGLNAALATDHDLVVLDLMLPDQSGEEVLHMLLASRPSARVLILSSVLEVSRRVGALNGGAVDFVPKPFVNAELLARVRLRLRDDNVRTPSSPFVPIDSVGCLDVNRQELVINDQRISLSQREFTLLTHLLQHKGETCSREDLLAEVWGVNFDPGTNVVDVYVGRLRAKLAPDTIETVRNVGYRLVAC
ncbi:MAG: DNA-binding response regulator [Pseudonocardiales bacterium]|nr:MAG: DNA-binding response regulator [Pseudonocardiales bacterium]